MTIIATPKCPACQLLFGLTAKQCNSGLLAQRHLCAPDRTSARRKRRAAAKRDARAEIARGPGCAPIHADPPLETLRALLTAAPWGPALDADDPNGARR